MTNRRPLEITTPTNGMALGAYGMAIALGGVYLGQIANSSALGQFVGRAGGYAWGLSSVASGLLAMISSILARQAPRITAALRGEWIGCLTLAVTMAIYLTALFVMLPYWETAFTTKLVVFAYIVGSILRAIQISYELRKLKVALRLHAAADPPPLGDPRR